jgi:hypothetical protein
MENSEPQPSQDSPLPEPNIEQTPPTIIEEQPVKKKRSVIKIVFIVLGVLFGLLFLLIVGAYFYLQSQGLTPDKLSPEPKAPQITIAPRDADTNTYQNQNYKFSIPLAKDLKAKESSYGFGVTSIELRAEDAPADYGADFQMLLFPKALGAAIGQDFNKYYDTPDNTTQQIKDPSGASQKFTKVRNRTINNSRAFEFKSTSIPEDPEVDAEIGVYIEMGNDVLVVTTGESNNEKLESMLADFHYPLK